MGKRKYFTDEERKAAHKEAFKRWYLKNRESEAERKKQWRDDNPEYHKQYSKQYYLDNREEILEYNKQYNKQYYETKLGRAGYLFHNYKQSDIDQNRGDCTLTPEWIVENIFTKPCHYCGESDWMELGCDRIDNTLPHTPDNVVPCCGECNKKKARYAYDEYMRMIGKIS